MLLDAWLELAQLAARRVCIFSFRLTVLEGNYTLVLFRFLAFQETQQPAKEATRAALLLVRHGRLDRLVFVRDGTAYPVALWHALPSHDWWRWHWCWC